MTSEELRHAVLDELRKVAPEADPEGIAPTEPLREQLDLDSLDFLRFVVGLHRALGIEVPEADYASLATLESCMRYLAQRLEASLGAGASPVDTRP